MNFKTGSIVSLCLLSLFALTSCENEEVNPNLRRDTDAINIGYNEGATATVTVRYDGQWYAVSDVDWLSVSPDSSDPTVGNGKDFQTLTITASRNAGDSRKGTIRILSSNGVYNASVEVTQADGNLSISAPEVAGGLYKDEAAAASIVLKYSKAKGGEKVKISASIDGDAALSIASETEQTIDAEGDGSISVSIKGTPSIFGDIRIPVTVTIDGNTVYAGTLTASVLSPDIIYIQTFDKMIFGGDYPNNQVGIGVEGKQTYYWNAPEELWTPMAKLDQDGTYDVFGDTNKDWAQYDIKAYRKDRGIDGWEGAKVYEHPGYIKVGTGSAAGWFKLPALSKLNGTSTVTLTMKLLRFDNTTGNIVISTEEGGTVLGGTLTADNFPAQTSADSRKWTVKSFIIEDANPKTRIKVSAETSADLTKTRFNVDSIVVSTSVKKLTEQLAAVDPAEMEVVASANGFDITWPEVENADAYQLVLYLDSNKNFKYSVETEANKFSFKNIPEGAYTLEITAVSYSQPEFNSEMTSKKIVTEGGEQAEISVDVAFVTESQYGIRWSVSDFKDFDTDFATNYRLETWKDAACTQLHSAHVFAAENSIFSSTRNIPYKVSPQFMVSGLESGRDYWVKVIAPEYALEKVVKVTLPASKVVTMPAATAAAGDVILYEDFSEWSFAGGCVQGFPAWCQPTSTSKYNNYNAEGDDPIGNSGGKLAYCNPDKHSGLFNSFKWHVTESRLATWGAYPESNTAGAICMAGGQVKIGASSKAGQIVTPAITCLSGPAEVEVSFDASPYMDPTTGTITPYKFDIASAIVQVFTGSTRQDESGFINHEVGTPSEEEGKVHRFTLPTASDSDYKWVRYTFTVKVGNGDAIGLGSYREDGTTGQRRMYLDNIQLKVVKYL
ncbi:MAG: BACON domain-containing carbohydrate-binding protein [Bacteroidales bacterium]|nr:BACON domain-containing carbohydrate-binding protein [Bacteroidales bacterium]